MQIGRLKDGGAGLGAGEWPQQVAEALWERRGGVGRCMGGSVGGPAGRIGMGESARGDGTFGDGSVGRGADE